MRIKLTLLTTATCIATVLGGSTAGAEITFQAKFGSGGGSAGKFINPAGLAVNTAADTVYVADHDNNRVEEFKWNGSTFAFVRTWGYDVVAAGPGNVAAPANEVQEIRVRAMSGTFSLSFRGVETAQLPFDATGGEVQTALNGLSTINSGGGSVSVAGGPGNELGEHPYLVTFSGGTLAGVDQELLGIDTSGLGTPAGTELTCKGEPSVATSSEGFEKLPDYAYRWLANGAPVVGANSKTFTPGPPEEGKAIQCQVTGTIGAVAVMAASRPYQTASPAPGTLSPLGPASLAKPAGTAVLEAEGGAPLTCSAGSWTRGPETFTYRWYRNGVEIGSPTTTAETTNEYVLTDGDLGTRATFQCAVTGTNAGGSSTTISEFLQTSPGQTAPEVRQTSANVTVNPSGSSKAYTRTNGGPVFEVCEVGAVCKAGVAGNGFGQLSEPRGIAVDNSPSGSGEVYVMDDKNPRVQKFSASGQPILEIGKGVDQTTDSGVCTAASGHACGGGILDDRSNAPGDDNSSPGAFGAVVPQSVSDFSNFGNELSVDAAGDLYVGDSRGSGDDRTQPRIEKFGSAGGFLGQARMPYVFSKPTAINQITSVQPISVIADAGGRAYASTGGEFAGVQRFLPSEFSLAGYDTKRAGNLFDEDGDPRQLALDPRQDRILASDLNTSETVSICGGPQVSTQQAILEYDSDLNLIDCTIPDGSGVLPKATGMAVLPSQNLLLVAVATASVNQIKIFKLPTPTPPTVGAQSATKITTETATIHAQINPGFEDTAYRVRYGLQDCETHSCEEVSDGGVLHGLKDVDGATQITGLEPGTTYHYQVIAENPLGEGEGVDRTFTTFRLVDLENDPCPNALARKQTKTAGLLDCRAYELASAAFAGGYDVASNLVAGQAPYDLYQDADGRVLYGVKDGGIPGAGKPTNRGLDPYVATRNEDGAWTTNYVGIPSNDPFATEPFSSTLSGADSALGTFSFAGEICNHCFADGSSGLPVHLPDGELAQGMIGSESDPTAEPAGYVAKPLSGDGSHLVFGSDAKLEPAANESGDPTIYSRDLEAGTTEVVSTDAGGATLSGSEVGELDVSSDGSRVLVGAEVGADGAGNPLWHLYLHLAVQHESIDLMPAATQGAYFDGMTSNGKRMFFTTTDRLLPTDEDESADIYEDQVDFHGGYSLRLVSVHSDGSPSNDDSCTPSNEPASWNTPAGSGKCGALAFAGGAGLASSAGDFYFLSPERLEGSEGIADQPNLYVVHAGGTPQFVATIDTSVGKPGPKPPNHPLIKSSFSGGPFELVQALTVDQSTHDVYAIDPFAEKVYRYDSSGAPHDFSAGPHEDNALTGLAFEAFTPSGAEVAVDRSAGPLAGDIYLSTTAGVQVFAQSGQELGVLDGSATNKGKWTVKACGVAVDQSSGTVYVGDSRGYVWQYTPNSPSGEITDADYTVKGLKPEELTPCAVAADGAGHVYAAKSTDGPVRQFATASFATGTPPTIAGTEIDEAARALATDPATHEVYVDEGNRIAVFNSSGVRTATIGQGKLSCGSVGSRGVAVDATSHHVYASCFAPSAIKEFGYEVPPYTPVDNPAILGAAHPLVHHWSDFQVTKEGRFAAFDTTMPLEAGYDNASHYEVYRYDGEGEELTCVSCDPTEGQARGDSALPPNGLGILDDGRVFFNTTEQLTLRDTNEKLDGYEWSPQREAIGGCDDASGCQQLISAGTSPYTSGMLGVSRNGTDAFFFTRDALVSEDENGQAMKIYDARSGGGNFVIPPPPACAASDECHGPGTQAAAPPQIGSFKGTGGQHVPSNPKPCKKGYVKRQGKCVKKPHHKRAHRKRGVSR